MRLKKLSLHDFEAVETAELLEVKGGYQGIDNCNQCDSRRCNGASHSSFSSAIGGAWDAITSFGGAVVGSFTSYVNGNGYGVAATGAVGYYNNVAGQLGGYYSGYSTSGCGGGSTGAPSRARIITGSY